jgi:2-polyprenyl-3-methyl-5-hydroxy-6-metoxy-1,4-benzoquinol methylase
VTGCNLCGCGTGRKIFVKNGFSLVECSACSLVYVADPPSPEELKRLYSFEGGYHNTLFDPASDDAVARRAAAREYYAVLSKFRSGGSVLDIGCSSGFFLIQARDGGWEARGLEMSADTARVARDQFGLDVATGTLEETTFPEARFDVVTLWDVIEHVPDPVRTLSLVHRILKDDGLVMFVTPNVGGLFPRVAYAAARIIRYWPHPEPPHHLFQFSKRTARELARRTGFAVLRILDLRIPINYTFGGLAANLRSPKQLLYTLFFAPLAAFGPLFRSGDSMLVIAKKTTNLPGRETIQ